MSGFMKQANRIGAANSSVILFLLNIMCFNPGIIGIVRHRAFKGPIGRFNLVKFRTPFLK